MSLARALRPTYAPGRPALVVDADAAAQAINTWIQTKATTGQQANYSVGVAHNGDIYISKVGGVTSKTPFVRGELAKHITGNRYHVGRDTDNVALGAQRGGSHQNGWAHPYAPILFGSSINNDTDARLDKLKLLPVNPTEDGAQKAGVRWWPTAPAQGSREPWL